MIKIKDIRQFKRHLTQLVASVLYNFNIKGFLTGTIYQGRLKSFCVPSLNCYSCPGAVMSCPLGTLQNGVMKIEIKYPYYILGVILLFSVLLARFICGFLCPFGFLQDILYKIKTKKLKKNKLTKKLTKLKYALLIIFVLIIPIIFDFPAFCKFICPAGTLEGSIPLAVVNEQIREMLHFFFTIKFIILVLVLFSIIFIYRSFCRFLCPLGAIYGLFNKISFVRMKVDENKCINCDACVNICLMDIKKVGDKECIMCGKCIPHCPKSAISGPTP